MSELLMCKYCLKSKPRTRIICHSCEKAHNRNTHFRKAARRHKLKRPVTGLLCHPVDGTMMKRKIMIPRSARKKGVISLTSSAANRALRIFPDADTVRGFYNQLRFKIYIFGAKHVLPDTDKSPLEDLMSNMFTGNVDDKWKDIHFFAVMREDCLPLDSGFFDAAVADCRRIRSMLIHESPAIS